MLLKRGVIILLIVSIYAGQSQNSNEQELQIRHAWRERTVKDFYNTFNSLYQKQDTFGMRIASQMMLEIALKSNKAEDFIRAYHKLSFYHQVKGSYQSALNAVNKAVSYFKDAPGFPYRLTIFTDEGRLKRIVGDYAGALESYLAAQEILNGISGLIGQKVNVRYNIAAIKSQVYNVHDAVELYKQNIDIIENSKDTYIKQYYTSLITDSWAGIASSYIHIKDYTNALHYCNKILEEGISKKYTYGITVAYLGFADIYSLTGEYQKALQAVEQLEKIEDQLFKEFFQVFINLYKARIYHHQNKIQASITELQAVEKEIEKQQLDVFVLQEVYVLFAKNYQILQQNELALAYYDKSLSITKDNVIKKSRISQNIAERYDLVNFNNEIAALSKKSKTQRELIWGAILILLLLMIAICLYIINRKKKNKIKFDTLLKELDTKQTGLSHISSKDSKAENILLKLESLENKLYFLDETVTQYKLAKKLDTNTSYLSKIINEHKQCSFSDYITNLRIKHSIQRLRIDKNFRKFSIVAISKESGFKSMTPFVRAFRLATDLYPSYFIKQLNKQEPK